MKMLVGSRAVIEVALPAVDEEVFYSTKNYRCERPAALAFAQRFFALAERIALAAALIIRLLGFRPRVAAGLVSPFSLARRAR
jgi:hypothetical protein